jgi:glucose/arabinose dehydrogenase
MAQEFTQKPIFMQYNPFMKATVPILACMVLFGSVTGCRKTETTTTDNAVALRPPGTSASRSLDLQLIADQFVSPVGLVQSPDATKRLFVVDQVGKVWIIDSTGQRLPQPFIDITSKMVTLSTGYDERGLLGMAFHPNYKMNGKFYLFYTAPPPTNSAPTTNAGNTSLPMTWNNTTRVSEFTVSSNANLASVASEKILINEPHPQANHNGGTIAFGADGYLYISIGDGGNKNDLGPGHVEDWYSVNAGGNGQDIEANLMGSVLRIDVNTTSMGKNYAIPGDNPLVGKPGLDEIWAYGFRNPYRFSFDMSGSKRLFLGDAGQGLYEEINVVTKAGNYGWNVKEGTECFNALSELTELPSCPSVDGYGRPLLDPSIEAPNKANPEGGNFVVIVAGHVYRGNTIPMMNGQYVFANFSSEIPVPKGEVYVTNPAGPGQWSYDKLSFASFGSDNIGHYIKGFGQDLSGEVYILGTTRLGPTGTTGKVFKMVAVK